jgi:hypothetical protein
MIFIFSVGIINVLIIENKRSGQDGDRQVYSVFSNTNYNQWNLQLLAGYQIFIFSVGIINVLITSQKL